MLLLFCGVGFPTGVLVFYQSKAFGQHSSSSQVVEGAEVAELESHEEVLGHGHDFGEWFGDAFDEGGDSLLDFAIIVDHALAHALDEFQALAGSGEIVLIQHVLVHEQLDALLQFTYLIPQARVATRMGRMQVRIGFLVLLRLFDAGAD